MPLGVMAGTLWYDTDAAWYWTTVRCVPPGVMGGTLEFLGAVTS